MADTVIWSLTETGNRFSGFDVENPDALIHIIPRSFETEHADVIVIGGKLKMAQLMGITENIADIPAVNVHQCDAPVLYPDEFLVESVITGTGVAGLSDIFVAGHSQRLFVRTDMHLRKCHCPYR